MIAEVALRSAMDKELDYWEREQKVHHTEYQRGLVYGLSIAIRICKEEGVRARNTRLPFNDYDGNWRAEQFYNAILTTYNYLLLADTKRAKRRLEKIIESVKKNSPTIYTMSNQRGSHDNPK